MAVSLFLEILPGFWPQNFCCWENALLSRASSAAKGRDLVSEKLLINKSLVSEKMLGDKFLVSEVILDNKILCPRMSLGKILM